MRFLASVFLLATPFLLVAQENNPTQTNVQPGTDGNTPIFRVTVVSRAIQAVGYQHRSGWTKVDFRGTTIAPQAKGQAQINSRLGHIQIKLDVKSLPDPHSFGREFLTYVLWAITPEGRPTNLAEVVVDSKGNYQADNISADLQAFGLIITAEPYFAVAMPSDVVVMENIIRQDTKGEDMLIDAKYELMPRGEYMYHVPQSRQHEDLPLNSGKKNPLEIYEAMNALYIAEYARADKYSTDSYDKAKGYLQKAQDYQERKQWKPAIDLARRSVQQSEDARLTSLRRQQKEALDLERQSAADREAAAKAHAAQEAAAAAESARQAEASARQAQAEAAARASAESAKADADAARARADSEANRANAAAAEADRLRQQAVADRETLRRQLLQQFNTVLQTTETPRGLVINIGDVLFDFNKYTLKQDLREKLARLSGIILSHPGLNLKVEGYTDSVGTEEYNQKLSEQRATTVRDYLVSQGLQMNDVSAVGYGKQYPVASNDNAAGRAMNRRVQMVVSGEVIGVQIGAPPSQNGPAGAPPASGAPVPQP